MEGATAVGARGGLAGVDRRHDQSPSLNFSFFVGAQVTNALELSTDLSTIQNPPQVHVFTSFQPPEARVVSLNSEVLSDDAGIHVLKVRPNQHPSLTRVVEELELHVPRRAPAPFYWVIGDTRDEIRDALDHVCVSLIDQRFRDVTVSNDSGRKKVQWLQGVLNCHVSRFEIDPSNPLKVVRSAVEILMAPHGLLTVDQDGSSEHLLRLREEIASGQVSSKVSSCIGALAAKVVEEQIVHNEVILDRLESHVDKWSKLTTHGPLLDEQVHDMLPTLTETLAFVARKIKQTEEVLTAMEEAGRDNPHFFVGEQSRVYLTTTRSMLQNLVAHAESILNKLKRVEDRHDRQMTSKGDKNIERFTFLLGISAPPMMADIACKMLLPDHHELHAPISIASFIVGVGLVGIAVLPDWLHDRRLRRDQSLSELGTLATEIHLTQRSWLGYARDAARGLLRAVVVEPGKRLALWLPSAITNR